MNPYALPEQEARNLAQAMAYRRGGLALMLVGGNSTPGRVVTGYVVEPYPGIPDRFGVIERWRYGDRPDLPEFGGGFIEARILVRLAGLAPRCTICRRLLDTGEDDARDCGGDCRACMAEAGDPDCAS